MVAPLSQSKRDAIKQRLDEKIPHIKIAEEMSVSIQTVKNYSANLKHHDVVKLPTVSRRGQPPRMNAKCWMYYSESFIGALQISFHDYCR